MAGVVSKSVLHQKLGAALSKAQEVHGKRQNELVGFDSLPAGINDGVAELRGLRFTEVTPGKADAGKLVFNGYGVVRWPEFHPVLYAGPDGVSNTRMVKTLGQRTFVTEKMYDTLQSQGRKTVVEHLGKVYEWLRNFGVNTDQAGFDQMLFDVCEMLSRSHLPTSANPKGKPIFFQFRTFSMPKQEVEQDANGKFWVFDGKKQQGPYRSEAELKVQFPFAGRESMVNHMWGPACDWTPPHKDAPPNVLTGIVDNTAQQPTNGSYGTSIPAGHSEPVAARIENVPQPPPQQFNEFEQQAEDSSTEGTLESVGPVEEHVPTLDELTTIAKDAHSGNIESGRRLQELALNVGASQHWLDEVAASWQEVVDVIVDPSKLPDAGDSDVPGDEESGESSDTQTIPWQAGDACRHNVMDQRSGGKVPLLRNGQPVTDLCTVKSVDAVVGTANLQSMSDPKKVYTGVPLAALLLAD